MAKLKILLDECLDKRIAKEIPHAFIKTVPQMGWAGLSNGKLLIKAQDRFDIFLTSDRNLSFQQNIKQYHITVVVLCPATNKLEDLRGLIPKFLRQLSRPKMGPIFIR